MTSQTMNVAMISANCPASAMACEKLEMFFERMVTPENQKIPVIVKNYTMEDLDQLQSAAEIFRAKIQILAFSREIFENMKGDRQGDGKKMNIGRTLDARKAIVIGIQLQAAEVRKQFELGETSESEDSWFILELDDLKLSNRFREAFAKQVLKIYSLDIQASNVFSIFPKKVTNDQPKFSIFLRKPVTASDSVCVSFSKMNDSESTDEVVPATAFLVRLPEQLCTTITSLVDVHVSINGDKIGTKVIKYEYQGDESKSDLLGRLIKNLPGFQNFLDDHVSHVLSKTFVNGKDWAEDPDLQIIHDVMVSRAGLFPTLMHFGAFYGLEKTICVLLAETEGIGNCAVKNDNNETPLDMASEQIRQMMKDIYEMSKSCTAISEFQKLMQGKKTLKSDVTKEKETESDVLDSGIQEADSLPLQDISYANATYESEAPSTPVHFYVNDLSSSVGSPSQLESSYENEAHSYENVATSPSPHSAGEGNGSRGRLDSSGDELEGLMQQYENDVDSRLKVDELVRRWSTRNEGANTPESRQQRLSQMRTDFSQIKEESAKTKKTSLFARICNFFGRRKGRSVKAVELDDLEARGDITAEGVGPSGTVQCVSSTTVNESTGKQAQLKSTTQRERVKWKMSPVTPKRILVAPEESPESPFRMPPSTPKASTFKKLKSREIRTPPETPMRRTECDLTPQLPLKAKGSGVSYLCSPRRLDLNDSASSSGSQGHAVSTQNYYKVPPPPRPVNFPPLDVESGRGLGFYASKML